MTTRTEELCAFLDGSLAEPERERVRAWLASDPEAAEQLARQVLLAQAARESFRDDLAEAIPDKWIAMVDAATAGAETGKVASLAARRDLKNAFLSKWPAGFAVAASLALGFYVGSAPNSGALIEDRGGTLVASAKLAREFDRARSGARVELASGRTLDVQLSLQTADGSYCREAIVGGADFAHDDHILACKDQGAWRIAALAQASPRQIGYETVASERPLDPLISSFEGHALDRTGEEQAIRQNWRAGGGGARE